MYNRYDNYYKNNSNKASKSDLALLKCVVSENLVNLYRINPLLFNLNKLSGKNKAELLKNEWDIFKDQFVVSELSGAAQADLFKSRPKRYALLVNFSKFSKLQLSSLVLYRTTWHTKYNIPSDRLSVNAWYDLMLYDDTKIDVFVSNLHTITVPTALRSILKRLPEIIPSITPDAGHDSCLTAKQWLLLLNSSEITRSGYNYNDEMINWLRMETSVDLLSGKSFHSVHLNRALIKASVV